MRLLLSVSVLGHLCTETSVGCLRKETCRAASRGLSFVFFILKTGGWSWAESGSCCWQGVVLRGGGSHVELRRSGTVRCRNKGSVLFEVQRHHQLHLCNQSFSAQENTDSCSIWTPSLRHYHLHSNSRSAASFLPRWSMWITYDE